MKQNSDLLRQLLRFFILKTMYFTPSDRSKWTCILMDMISLHMFTCNEHKLAKSFNEPVLP